MQNKISQVRLAGKAHLNSLGVLLAMILAGLLGRYGAEVATRPISNELTKLVVGIIIGMLIGLGTGFVVQRAWGRFMEIVS